MTMRMKRVVLRTWVQTFCTANSDLWSLTAGLTYSRKRSPYHTVSVLKSSLPVKLSSSSCRSKTWSHIKITTIFAFSVLIVTKKQYQLIQPLTLPQETNLIISVNNASKIYKRKTARSQSDSSMSTCWDVWRLSWLNRGSNMWARFPLDSNKSTIWLCYMASSWLITKINTL